MNDDLPSSPGCLSKFSFCAQAPCKKLMKNYAHCAEQCLYLLLFVQKRNIALCKVWSKWTLGRHYACCFLYLFETLNICKILITITKEKEGALFVYKQTFFWVSQSHSRVSQSIVCARRLHLFSKIRWLMSHIYYIKCKRRALRVFKYQTWAVFNVSHEPWLNLHREPFHTIGFLP